MKIAVVSAVYNEEKYIGRLIESLLAQACIPDEIIFVDDGSKDGTAKVIEGYAARYSTIRLIRNTNQGPAASRNMAWRNASSEIVIFTDGDCVPDPDWTGNLLRHFTSEEIAAVAGTYRTLNTENILARFVGYEIAWRYRNVRGEIDVHGAYNLAVRRRVLEEMNGFNEIYKAPSGEDFDLTFRISRKYKILFAADAVVAHAHPESFWWYMRNQTRRGFDRMKLYYDHPEKRGSDTYTGKLPKYQVLAAGLLVLSLFLLLFPGFISMIAPVLILPPFLFLFGSCFYSFPYIFKRDPMVACYGAKVQFFRSFAWALGAAQGLLRFGFKLK
ncbi:MAG TPA: glycosyltransferase family A protein [Candidatus Omnitrophota bacterium]|nr:glycosyltransferase family A protein [Candidatus Omnitrophota bacterium]HPS36673.1 glycosyltransferase family A protein [Candidatus Omnitrophota bacterium]